MHFGYLINFYTGREKRHIKLASAGTFGKLTKFFHLYMDLNKIRSFTAKKNRKNCTLLLLDQIIFEQDRMRLGIAKLKNFVFHLSLLSPFTIFATNKHPKKK